MNEKYQPGQFVPIEEYQETISYGGPTPSGTASNTWPVQVYRPYCPTCHCGCSHYTPWSWPWVLYTNR